MSNRPGRRDDDGSAAVTSFHPLILSVARRVMQRVVLAKYRGQITYEELYVAGQWGAFLAWRRITAGSRVVSQSAYIGTAARHAMIDWLMTNGWLRGRGCVSCWADTRPTIGTGHPQFLNHADRRRFDPAVYIALLELEQATPTVVELPTDVDCRTADERARDCRRAWKQSPAGKASKRRQRERSRERQRVALAS